MIGHGVFVGTFAKLPKETDSFIMFVCPQETFYFQFSFNIFSPKIMQVMR